MPTLLPTPGPSLLEALDRQAFLAINATAQTPAWLIDAARFIATVPLYLLPLALLYLWCRGDHGLRGHLLRALGVTAVALASSLLIGLFWPHPRPFAIGLGHAWLAHAANASFPSDHLTIFAGCALSLLFDDAWLLGALIDAARFIATVPLYLLPLALLYLWCRGDHGLRGHLLRALGVTAVALASSLLIGLFWPHPRPFAIGLGHAWLAHAANASFPSDHLTIFAGCALSLLFDDAWLLGALIGAVGLAVGYARVYLGIHSPLDMLGALAVAAVSNSMVWLLWQRHGGALTARAETLYRHVLAPAISRGWLRH